MHGDSVQETRSSKEQRNSVPNHNFVDAKKIGCIGASYGGFMTQYLQTKTDIFAAAISHAGISDITSYWGEGYWGYSYSALASAKQLSLERTGYVHVAKPAVQCRQNQHPDPFPAWHVDTNVPVGESIQMFTALETVRQTYGLRTSSRTKPPDTGL